MHLFTTFLIMTYFALHLDGTWNFKTVYSFNKTTLDMLDEHTKVYQNILHFKIDLLILLVLRTHRRSYC